MVNQLKPTIAIFGGSFDPPHMGHQQIVENAVKRLDIDQLFVVPAYLNPFKKSSLADAQTRLQWCHELFDDIQGVIVDDYEIKEGKSTVTSQSVKHFSQNYHVKYLIIGSDNLSTLHKWHDYTWLNENVIWVIATRSDHAVNTDGLRAWEILPINAPISSTQIRDKKDLQYIDKRIQASVKNILEGKQLL